MKTSHIVLALAAALLLAPTSAMAVFTSDVCSENAPSNVLDADFPFENANGDEKTCKKLCRVQGKVCEKVARSTVRCYGDEFEGDMRGEKEDCKDEENAKDCKREVNEIRKSVRGSLKAELGDEREDCRFYVDECMQECEFEFGDGPEL